MATTEVEVLVQSVAPTVVTPTYVPVEVVVQGPQGIKGDTGTMAIGTTLTGAAGAPATVTNTGTPQNAVLNFTIPQGIQGIQGVKGDTGTLALGTVTTGAAGTNAIITNTGTASAGIFNFTIPKGDKGDTGTLALGTVSTGAPGSSVVITNTGTPTNGVFNFTIPRGDTGATGTITLGTVATGAAGSSVVITNTGTPTAATFNFTIPQGIQGIPGSKWYTGAGVPPTASYALGDWYLNTTNSDVYEKTGATAWTLRTNIKGATGTMSLGTVTTGAAGSSAVITNTGTPTAGVFNFTIPQGIQGIQGPSGTMVLGTVTTGAAGSSAAITNSGTSTNAVWNFTIPKGDQGIQGIQGPSGTIGVGTVGSTAVGTAPTVTNVGTSQAAIFNFTFPAGAGVQIGGATNQILAKKSNADFDTQWVNAPTPVNMVTTDTAQSITAVKTFTVSPVVPNNSFAIAATTGLQTALDSKYQSGATPVFSTTDVQGALTVGTNTVGTTNQIIFRDPGVGGTQQFIFSRATDSAGMKVTEAVGDQILYQFYMADNPDGGDFFSWYFTDWAGGNWEPLRIGALTNEFKAAGNNFWGNINQATGPWYSGNAGVVGQVTKIGTGTLTLTPNVSAYSGTSGVYWVQIDGVGTPNTFRWGTGQTGTNIVASLIPITGAAQTLNSGITVTFNATTGGVLNDNYQFRANSGGNATLGKVTATSVWEGANRVYSATTGMATTVATANTYGLASVVGTGTLWARNDHHHGTPPAQVITAGAGITATASGVNYTVTNTGVLSVTASGNLTSSGGQNPAITMTATPVFTGVTIGTDPAATQPWVTAQINTLINGAPGALDSLNELAAAMGNDPNFATTMTNNLATKAADNTVVHLAGTETITGAKTFTSTVTQQAPSGSLIFVSNAASALTGGYLQYVPGADATNRLNITGSGAAPLTLLQMIANSAYISGTLNTGGNITENGNRVYSIANPPPYPVTSVAGRTGAVTLTGADIGAGTFAGTMAFSSQAVFSSGLALTQANGGMEMGSTTVANTPFIDFHSSGGAEDYTARIIASGGTSGTSGSGGLAFYASISTFQGATQHNGVATITTSNGSALVINSAATGRGAEIALQDTTAAQTTPSKFIRAFQGNFQIVNSAYTTSILSLSDGGTLSVIGQLLEGGVRMYSANNPPPYPVSSVAGRAGAVTLTTADVSGSVDISSAQTVTGQKTFAAAILTTANGNSAEAIRIGNDASLWDVDVANTIGIRGVQNAAIGGIMFGTAGPQISGTAGAITVTGTLNTSGTLTEAGNRVYSPANAPVQGIPFHVGGTVGTGLKPPKYIAMAPMTLRSARANAETGTTLTYSIYVNGAVASGGTTGTVGIGANGTTAPVFFDFPDVNINAGDRVQLFVATADATATELSVTVEAVTR